MEPDEDAAELLRRGVSPVPAETVERSVDAVLGRLRAGQAARAAGTAEDAPPGQPATAVEAARTAEDAERGTSESDDAGDAPPAGEVPPAGAPDVDRPDPVGAAAPIAPIGRHAAALPEGCGSVS